MVEVVRSNFQSFLPHILDCIESSIDTEFTGLSVSPEDDSSLFDTVEKWYHKLKKFARSFIICQFGLSVFMKDPKSNRYVAHTFNFFLVPRPQGSTDSRFLFQASNVEFLCEYHFDFNKLFYQGIPYLNEVQETELFCQTGARQEETEMKEALGFTAVFRALVKSGKPLLGHNMLSDLALMYDKFHRPLPESYSDFKQALHLLFPLVIDTKHLCYQLRRSLAQTNLLEFSSLFDLYEALGSERGTFYVLCSPDISHAESSERYMSQTFYHEAGFDAYCVGFVFLRIAHLVAMKGVKSTETYPVHLKQYFRLVEPYSNRINVISGPIRFMDLAGTDRPSLHSDWLVVQSRSGTPLNAEMLQDLSGDFGSMDIHFIPESPSKALVVLTSQRRAQQVLEQNNEVLIVRRYWWIRDSPRVKWLLWQVLWTGLGAGLLGLIIGMILPRLR